MKNIEQLLNKENWIKYLELADEDGITNHGIAQDIVKEIEEAINYSRCCKSDIELLKELKEPTLDEWLKANFIPLGNSGFTNRNEDTVWTKGELAGIHATLHL